MITSTLSTRTRKCTSAPAVARNTGRRTALDLCRGPESPNIKENRVSGINVVYEIESNVRSATKQLICIYHLPVINVCYLGTAKDVYYARKSMRARFSIPAVSVIKSSTIVDALLSTCARTRARNRLSARSATLGTFNTAECVFKTINWRIRRKSGHMMSGSLSVNW